MSENREKLLEGHNTYWFNMKRQIKNHMMCSGELSKLHFEALKVRCFYCIISSEIQYSNTECIFYGGLKMKWIGEGIGQLKLRKILFWLP